MSDAAPAATADRPMIPVYLLVNLLVNMLSARAP
jgi:hypothetical protein